MNSGYLLVFCFLIPLSFSFCAGRPDSSANRQQQKDETGLQFTTPVIFRIVTTSSDVSYEIFPGASKQKDLAEVHLSFRNLPADKEGLAFTLVGGGVDVGFHGPNATGFEGTGVHFAGGEGNPPRTPAYKQDFTRTVQEGRLEFTFWYTPTDIITHWDPGAERYVPHTEVTLTMHPFGEWNNVLAADINPFNWCLAGLGKGNKARIVIVVP